MHDFSKHCYLFLWDKKLLFISFWIVSTTFSVFKDINTPSPFTETFPTVEGEGAEAALPDHIYMDSVSCGLGMSCIQVHSSLLKSFLYIGNLTERNLKIGEDTKGRESLRKVLTLLISFFRCFLFKAELVCGTKQNETKPKKKHN